VLMHTAPPLDTLPHSLDFSATIEERANQGITPRGPAPTSPKCHTLDATLLRCSSSSCNASETPGDNLPRELCSSERPEFEVRGHHQGSVMQPHRNIVVRVYDICLSNASCRHVKSRVDRSLCRRQSVTPAEQSVNPGS
jgi:hypothetical protein